MISFTSMVDLLEHRAATQADERAYIFLTDRGAEESTLTFAGLFERANALAGRLAAVAKQGDRALLVFPPGLEFVVAFFGCLIAGVIAVPMMVPRRQSARDSSASIVANCASTVALTSPALAIRDDLRARFADSEMQWISVDLAPGEANKIELPRPKRDDIAFLQYTSGSTSDPKGVVVTYANLLENLEMIRVALGNTKQSTFVNWVPLYHDMGLILNVLQSLYVGALCVLMSPNTFMQRPLLWLRAIHDYRAEVAAAPNYGFDLCVNRLRADQMEGIDLSSWKIALTGAEPVRAETLERFVEAFAPYGLASGAVYPAYGMAEATLMITAGRRGGGYVTRTVSNAGLQAHVARSPVDQADAHIVVGCGRALPGQQVAIVDPETRVRLGTNVVNEVWASGLNIAQAYWQDAAATAAGLEARIAGEDDTPWLRTGDLGFLDASGELFITGRIKDLIIVRGINHYPQDIEHTVQSAHPALRQNGGAAFSVVDERGGETLVIVQEVERTARNKIDPNEIMGVIREAVTNEHEVFARHIVLIRPSTLPKTTSGKIQRGLTRKLWQEQKLDYLAPEAV